MVDHTHPRMKVRVNRNPSIVACTGPARICREMDRVLALADVAIVLQGAPLSGFICRAQIARNQACRARQVALELRSPGLILPRQECR